ncbi:MAG: HepT-like ribonuclease domain-containing protein [Bacteroidota bacterium]
MTDQGRKYLSDILYSIGLIEDFLSTISNYNDYVADLKTQSAVERQLGIIGEAVNKFDKLFPDSTLQNAKKIVGFRNRIVHAYDAVDTSIVWAIVRKHLTPLKAEVEEKLKQ